MLILFIKIFTKSYRILDTFYLKNKLNIDWEKNRINTNKELLNYVFAYISKTKFFNKVNKNFLYDQFKLDLIVELLNYHLSKRVILFNKLNKFNNQIIFVLFSLIEIYFIIIKRILHSLLLVNKEIPFDYSNTSFDIFIGFPKHAFSYTDIESNTENSFCEYLKNNNILFENKSLSINEYIRPSFKYEVNYVIDVKVKEKNRINIETNSKNTRNLFVVLKNIILSLIDYFKYFNVPSVSLFYFFLNNKIIFNRLNNVFNSINKYNEIKNIYLCSYFDIGLYKFLKRSNYIFKSVVYSGNIYHPMSSEFINKILSTTANKIKFEENDIFQTDLYVYSLYHNKPIGFNNNLILINKLKKIVNKKFQINLQKHEESLNYFPFNLGFERILNLDLDRNIFNILIFDIPLFTEEQTYQMSMAGDIYGNENFLSSFYNEIYEYSIKFNAKIYLKPKYSLNSKLMKEKQVEMIKKINPIIIDPYSKIILDDNLFNLSIHLPFTSSFEVFNNLSNKNIYYIPDKYSELFTKLNSENVIIGQNNLYKLLTNINLNK
jgi:hypothetical protein